MKPKTTNVTDDDELIDLAAVQQIVPVGRSRIYSDPAFPQPVTLVQPGQRGRWSRWVKREVLAYRRALIAQRDAHVEARRRALTKRAELKRQKELQRRAR